jgi:Trk K+ transport system NAD-binding subunit
MAKLIPALLELVEAYLEALRAEKQEQNILVLLVERHDARPATAVARTVFRDGDRLTVFGGYAAICAAFHAVERFTDDSDF